MTNKDLLYSTGNSTQYSARGCMGKESKKYAYIYIFMTDSLYCMPETNTTLYSNHTPTHIFLKSVELWIIYGLLITQQEKLRKRLFLDEHWKITTHFPLFSH